MDTSVSHLPNRVAQHCPAVVNAATLFELPPTPPSSSKDAFAFENSFSTNSYDDDEVKQQNEDYMVDEKHDTNNNTPINKTEYGKATARQLFDSIKGNESVKKCQHLLTEVELNTKDELSNSTMLHCVVELGRFGWLPILLQHPDINVNAKDGAGRTPLHVACLQGRRRFVKALIARGADVNAADDSGDTPLHCAAASNNDAAPLLKLLLGVKNITVNAANKEGLVPLHVAVINNCVDFVKILLDAGVDVKLDAADAVGRTPLHWAYMLRLKSIISLLEDSGANQKAEDKKKNKPMQLLFIESFQAVTHPDTHAKY